MKIAVQMYTLRDECEQDFLGTLTKVAKLGFKGVEFAGFYGYSAQEVRAHLEEFGLEAVGSHTSLEALENELEAIIEYNKVLGNSYIICPYSKWEDRDGLEKISRILNHASIPIQDHGMTLLYHNHAHEMDRIEGKYGLDELFELTKVAGVGMELDTHWLARIGVDPIPYMETYGERCQLVHLKDLKIINELMAFAALGEGTMNIQGIINTAQKCGVEWMVVENDMPQPNGFENIAVSMKYLKTLKV